MPPTGHQVNRFSRLNAQVDVKLTARCRYALARAERACYCIKFPDERRHVGSRLSYLAALALSLLFRCCCCE